MKSALKIKQRFLVYRPDDLIDSHKCRLPFSVLNKLLEYGDKWISQQIVFKITDVDTKKTIILGNSSFNDASDVDMVYLPENYLPGASIVKVSIISNFYKADKIVVQPFKYILPDKLESLLDELQNIIVETSSTINVGSIYILKSDPSNYIKIVSLHYKTKSIPYTIASNIEMTFEFLNLEPPVPIHTPIHTPVPTPDHTELTVGSLTGKIAKTRDERLAAFLSRSKC